MITPDQYAKYKALVEEYERAEYERNTLDAEEALDCEPEACPTCGEINGMENPCCPDYDPLHINNCGYG